MILAKPSNIISLIVSSVLFAGCSAPSAIHENTQNFTAPEKWLSAMSEQQTPIVNNWVNSFQDETLLTLIEQALNNNQEYKSNYYSLLLAEQQVTIAGATLLPELSLTAEQSRRKTTSNTTQSYNNTADISLQLSYEIDLWGKLSAQQRQANLQYAAAKAQLEQQRLTLITEVASTWFSLAEANQLLSLYQERAKNLSDNLDMMERSYRLGLNQALDVYLAKNDVSSQLARVADQQQQVRQIQRQLFLLLGSPEQPIGFNTQELPVLNENIAVGTPSEILARRPDLKSSWYDLLAADAGLAIAHKQRFPSIQLRANIGDSADDIGNLLSGDPLAWSLIGSLTAPIFNAGKLAAQEEISRITVKQKEQQYLQSLHASFVEVENALSNRQALQERYSQFNQSLENTLAAQKLAFDQYMKGLVTYSTVLEAQRRAFDTQTQLIQLTNQILQNKITLHAALGGNTSELANGLWSDE
ncbi:efflux transporter outer membrane subunit [Thalassotalea hakodatensis]|uniref:efflux transporter outer membrane subunit n=1 Tax=Thalassotalea hakodatensis TaxID=3030492 RepID=UPI002572FD36|nr:efflux transporter outer membrane subunit [Thalassotalea hakodatensis]